MNHVPVEVLQYIFAKLDLNDRVECTFVCRSWHDALNQSNLVQRLEITVPRYHNFKAMIKHLPYRATQVECLTLCFLSTLDFDKRELCNIFPNLRELKLRVVLCIKPTHTCEPFQFLYTSCKLALQLAKSDMCKKLKTLQLEFSFSTDAVYSNIISQLKDMPVSKHLILCCPSITLMDLEVLHHNLHLINRLQLKKTRLVSGDFPQGIVPASLVTQVEIELVIVVDLFTHIEFYKYIERKYSCIDVPVYIDRAILVEGCNYIRDVYNQGIFPLYQKIGSQFDNFTFTNYCDGLDAFSKFDQFGMTIKDLKIHAEFDDNILFIEDLMRPKQPKSIQKLTLEEMIPEPMEMMMNMEALSTLDINCHHPYDGINLEPKALNFSQLIEACPASLTHLQIDGTQLIFNAPAVYHTCIKYLEFSTVNLKPELITAIETNFPLLATFSYVGYMNSSVVMSLPKHHLDKVKIKILYRQDCGFSIKTINDDKVQCYVPLMCHEYDRRVRNNYKVIPVSTEAFDAKYV